MYQYIAFAIIELIKLLLRIFADTKKEIANQLKIDSDKIDDILYQEIKLWKKNNIYPRGLVILYLDTTRYKTRIKTEEDSQRWRMNILMYMSTVWYLPFFTQLHRKYKGKFDRSLVNNERYGVYIWYWDRINNTEIHDKIRNKRIRYRDIDESDYRIIVEISTKMATVFGDVEGLKYLINNLNPQKHYRYILWGIQAFRGVPRFPTDLDIPVEERGGYKIWR